MASTNKTVSLVPAGEQDRISRVLLGWLNEYPEKPVSVINFEFVSDGEPGMALSTIQAAYKIRNYILGGYQAQYQFKIIYRVQPGNSNNKRLQADEILNAMGDWASERKDLPNLGDGIRCLKIEANTRSSLFGRYENGDEDHQILMNMFYEVI